MTNEQVLQMENGLKQILTEPMPAVKGTTKVLYAVRRTIEALKAITAPLRETIDAKQKEVVGLKDYTEARIALCKKHSIRDASGEPVMVMNNYQIDPQQRKEFDDAIEALRAQHKEDFEKEEAVTKEMNEFLKEEIKEKISFYKMKLADIPDEFFNNHPERMDIIFYMLDED